MASRRPRCERAIAAFGVRLGIRTNDRRLLRRLLDVAPPSWKPTTSRALRRVWTVEVAPGHPEGMDGAVHILREGPDVVLRSARLDELVEDFERRVKAYVAEMAPARVFVHAGAVGLHGRAILVPGPSMSGKTRLVSELVRAGATYYSDEFAPVDARGRVHPYPAPLGVRSDSSARQEKVAVEALGGRAASAPLPVGAIVVTRHQPGARWRPRPLSPGLALLELLNCTLPARRTPRAVLVTLRKVVSSAATVTSVRGDARQTAAMIVAELSRAWAVPRAEDRHARRTHESQ